MKNALLFGGPLNGKSIVLKEEQKSWVSIEAEMLTGASLNLKMDATQKRFEYFEAFRIYPRNKKGNPVAFFYLAGSEEEAALKQGIVQSIFGTVMNVVQGV